MKDKILLTLITLGMLLITAGIVIPLFTHRIQDDTFRYIYAAGAAMLLGGRLFSTYDRPSLRLKRLYRLESWVALFFVVAAVMLFYNRQSLSDALAFTLAGGVIQIYTSIMIPIVARKEERKEDQKEESKEKRKEEQKEESKEQQK